MCTPRNLCSIDLPSQVQNGVGESSFQYSHKECLRGGIFPSGIICECFLSASEMLSKSWSASYWSITSRELVKPLNICLCTPVEYFQYAVRTDRSSHVSNGYSLSLCRQVVQLERQFLLSCSLKYFVTFICTGKYFIGFSIQKTDNKLNRTTEEK